MDKNEAIKIIRSNFPTGRKMLCEALEILIPELKESEDERIRKELVRAFTVTADKREHEIYGNGITYGQVLDWLEKQGEQKPEIKYIYPKFRVGDVIEPAKSNGHYVPVRVKYIYMKVDIPVNLTTVKRFFLYQYAMKTIMYLQSRSLLSGVKMMKRLGKNLYLTLILLTNQLHFASMKYLKYVNGSNPSKKE